ncbi:Carboxypeptidase A4, partial [Quaeritorhiza haematococci]
MRSIAAVLGFLALSTLGDAAVSPVRKRPYANDKVYQLHVDNEHQLNLLTRYVEEEGLGLDIWSEALKMGPVDIRIPGYALPELQSTLLKEIKYQVMIDDVQSLIDQEETHRSQNSDLLTTTLARLADSNDDASNVTDILTPEKIFADYQDTATYIKFLTSLPGVSQLQVGTTWMGNPITAVEFGTGSQTILFHGGIHAREWISPAVSTYLAWALATDPAAEKLRSRFKFVIIPVLNVDGYAHTRSSSSNRFWRKNRQPNAGSSCVGTDANRNFGTAWGKPGASGSPCSDTYWGASAFSTAEAKAVKDFVETRGDVISYIDFHAYSQIWMFAWGYTCNERAPDYDTLKKGGKIAVDALRRINQIDYTDGPICNTIYQASGSSVDWVYGPGKVKYTYTVELRDKGRNGFVLPARDIVPSGKETYAGVLALWTWMMEDIDNPKPETPTTTSPSVPTTTTPEPTSTSEPAPTSAPAPAPVEPK